MEVNILSCFFYIHRYCVGMCGDGANDCGVRDHCCLLVLLLLFLFCFNIQTSSHKIVQMHAVYDIYFAPCSHTPLNHLFKLRFKKELQIQFSFGGRG